MNVMEIAHNIIFKSEDENGRVARSRFIRDRLEHFAAMDDVHFVRRFRLSKKICVNLFELIDHRLEFASNKSSAVPPINQLLLCLRFYATGCTQISASDFSGVSEATAHRIIHRGTRARLFTRFIYFHDHL